MKAMRPGSALATLRDQALKRKIIDFEATRRARAAQERNLQYADWVDVGSPGAPAFENGWANATLDPVWEPYTADGRSPAGFFRDRWGFVHLRGVVDNAAHSTDPIFHLPAELYPAAHEYAGSSYKSEATGYGGLLVAFGCLIVIYADGAVAVGSYYETTYVPARVVSLDGLSWRAANVGTP